MNSNQTSRICPRCSTPPVSPTARFCGNCANPLPSLLPSQTNNNPGTPQNASNNPGPTRPQPNGSNSSNPQPNRNNSSDPQQDESHDRFSRITSILLLILTALISAFVAWQASLIANDAGGENLDGLIAVLNREDWRTFSTAQSQQHYLAYTSYVHNKQLGDLLNATASSEGWERRRDEAYDKASISQYFFITRYLDEEGNYDRERELGESAAEAERQRDINPAPHFSAADDLHRKSNNLFGTAILLEVAVLFFTLAYGLQRVPHKYIMAALGLIFLIGTVLVAGRLI